MGERYMPQEDDPLLGAEHLHRYQLAAELMRGKRVLDAACGEGYGSRILAGTADRVLGVDASGEMIDHAQAVYAGRSNLRFRKMNVTAMRAVRRHSFDSVVSFETIEHLDRSDQELFLQQIVKILRPGGILMISTPNRDVYASLRAERNPYHLAEFNRAEFENLLHGFFSHVRLLGQNLEMTGLISDGHGRPEQSRFRDAQGDPLDNAAYLIALCSDGVLPRQGIRSVYLSGYGACVRNTLRIRQLQEEEDERNAHIARQDQLLEEKGRQIRALHGQLEEVLNALRARSDVETDSPLKPDPAGQSQAQKVSGVMEDYLCRAADREASLRRQLASAIRMKEEQSAAYETILAQDRQTILNLQGHISQLIAAEQTFDRIRASRSYRVGRDLHRVSARLLPETSTRRFVLHVGFQVAAHPVQMIRFLRPHRLAQFFRLRRLGGMKAVRERYSQLEEHGYVIRKAGVPQKITGGSSSRTFLLPGGRPESAIPCPESGTGVSEQEHIHFETVSEPEVSVIIPVLNHFSQTWDCLKSLEGSLSGMACEVLIADDGSDDQTMELGMMADNLRICVNTGPHGFVDNCNQAAEKAAGRYLVFLNNDTIAGDDWLGPMLELMKKIPKAGIIGAKLIDGEGRLSEAGGIVWRDGSAWNYGRGEDPEDPEYQFVREVDYVSGACLMIRRDLFEQLGGFDRYFAPAYYEDTDLAFRVRGAGYLVLYQPKSCVVHLEGSSNGTDPSCGVKAWQVINREKFCRRWKKVLEEEHFPAGEDVLLAREHGRDRKRILVVDHYVPHFDHDAGGRCTFMWIRLFLKMGMRVTFIGDNYYRHEPYTSILGQMGVEVLYGDRYYLQHEQWLKENLKYYDYCYLQRPHIAIKYIDSVRKYGRCKIFYFAHDLHAMRLTREYQLTGDKSCLRQAQQIRGVEMELFRKADVVHVVGNAEQEILRGAVPECTVRNIPLYIYEKAAENIPQDFSKRQDLLFVGGFSHSPNVDAVLWFASRVWPAIARALPGIRWHIVGAQVPDRIMALAGPQIVIHGAVDDEQLGVLYRTCRMAVVPLRYGAGVKGKVVEAAYYQLPLVTTTIGAEGIRHEDCFAIEDDPARMADLIVCLYRDTGKLEAMSRAGVHLIETDYSVRKAQEVLSQDL